jgi:uncharacterized protein (DUF302 family)
MSYYFSKKTDAPFEEVLTKVADELKKEGFGIRTEVDADGTLRSVTNIEIQKIKILAGQQPSPEGDAATADEDSGIELSCYVIAQGMPGGTVKVAAIEPAHSTRPYDNPLLSINAEEVREKLYHVIANI